MKSKIPSIYSLYKPKRRRKRLFQPSAHKTQLPQALNSSSRFLSAKKEKESYLRHYNKSVEPTLPYLKSPEPLSSREVSANSSFSSEADWHKLELLISRNQSARKGLLSVQARIMELGANAAIKNNCLTSIHEDDENYLLPKPNSLLPINRAKRIYKKLL